MHVGLGVDNIEEARAFYQNKAGLKCSPIVEADSINRKICFCDDPDGGTLELIEGSDMKFGLLHVAFSTVPKMRIREVLKVPELGMYCLFAKGYGDEEIEFNSDIFRKGTNGG